MRYNKVKRSLTGERGLSEERSDAYRKIRENRGRGGRDHARLAIKIETVQTYRTLQTRNNGEKNGDYTRTFAGYLTVRAVDRKEKDKM